VPFVGDSSINVFNKVNMKLYVLSYWTSFDRVELVQSKKKLYSLVRETAEFAV